MRLSKIEPFRTVRALYYANRPMQYRDSGIKIINGVKFKPIEELSFGEKIKNIIDSIKEFLYKNSLIK